MAEQNSEPLLRVAHWLREGGDTSVSPSFRWYIPSGGVMELVPNKENMQCLPSAALMLVKRLRR